MSNEASVENLDWAINARERSQRLLLALYEFARHHGEDLPNHPNSGDFSMLVGVAFSLWRAAFLAAMPTRDWAGAVRDAVGLLKDVLETNAVSFGTEQRRLGWTGGYYLANAKLRLESAYKRLSEAGNADAANHYKRLREIYLVGTNPRETWITFCDEAEHLADLIGCRLPR